MEAAMCPTLVGQEVVSWEWETAQPSPPAARASSEASAQGWLWAPCGLHHAGATEKSVHAHVGVQIPRKKHNSCL